MSRLLSTLLLTIVAMPTLAATITVNTTADTVAVDGFCSLREAILAANTDTVVNECPAGNGADTIVFDLGPGVPEIIVVNEALPQIVEPLSIDGATGGATRVSIEGNGAQFFGLDLAGTGPHRVRSLVVGGFLNTASLTIRTTTTVQDCYLGTDPTGMIANGSQNGIRLGGLAAENSLIGGDQPGQGNLISGNNGNGIAVFGAPGAIIQGNRIGTDATGMAALPNTFDGIAVETAPGLLIGGPLPGQGNQIAGNGSNGILIDSVAGGITLQGNWIGLASDGTSALGNAGHGVYVLGDEVLIGGDSFDHGGNAISGNGGQGIRIADISARAIDVFGNRLGSSVDGDVNLGNGGGNGVEIAILADATEIRIGGLDGTDPQTGCHGRCNLIIGGLIDQSEGGRIEGNVFGLDRSGSQVLGISDFPPLQLSGGLTRVRGNLISGFPYQAMYVVGPGGYLIEGNRIGVAANGEDLIGNGGGITIAASDSLIRDNLIAGNGFGIEVVGNQGQYPYGVRISRNQIRDHLLLGIDLRDPGNEPNGGVTANDPLDTDDGPNRHQNFPDLISATITGNRIAGGLSSSGNGAFTIEFFQSSGCNDSGHGEGAQFLGEFEVQTDGDGLAVFDFTSPVALTAGAFVAATATDADDNTSEFSACIEVLAGEEPPPPPPPPATAVPVPLGSPWTWAILVSLMLVLVARQDRRRP